MQKTSKRPRVAGARAPAASTAVGQQAQEEEESVSAKKDAERDKEWMWKAEEIEVQDIPFTLTPGPQNCPAALTVLEAFSTIFPSTLLQHIVDDTNAYSAQKNDCYKLGSVTKEEVCTYFAILLAMSMKTAPALKDHWSMNSMLASPWIKEKMPRNRWLAIHKALHFNIHTIEEAVRAASQQHWIPSKKVCIDEGIGPWQGRKKGVRVYILGKPHPNGIKIYILADENNFIYDFWIYRGVQPSTTDIVMHFVNKLPGMC